MNNQKMLAHRKVRAVKPDGERLELTLVIGYPYEVTTGEWACPVALDGLFDRIADVHGIDSWQAIQLAYQLLVRLVADFVEKGSRLYWPGTEEPMGPTDLLQ